MIYPKCKLKDTQVPAIRYDGYVVPCCHMGGWGHIEQLRRRIGSKVEQMHITNNTLDEINTSDAWKYIEESWSSDPMPVCVRMCSKKENIDSNKTEANSDFTISSFKEQK